ncbi:hypothetical protein JG688_00008755 [Phytophthora aleatoria]|uniref:EF-hand domain-containing protein n=1 Tax=Phytophthora aleatoria TaxID=2496075 RepID=A0A8J5MG40_9STRA|nr:hypothetical protein JG688_00008755 [Phytophthora aleatoria]
MQKLHDNVTVFVTQRDLEARAPKPDGTSASTTALQYVAENSGFDVVTFRVDFSESASIKLHLPAEPGSAPINTLQKATQQLTFNCELHPFERRVLAYVVKRGKQRALVRVQYAVTAVVTPSVDAIVEGQERAAKMILQQLQRKFDRDQGPSALRLSWEQLFELEPAVWSITLGRRHEQRLRQIFLHERDIIKTTAVISVPTLTSITLSSSYLVHFTSETCSEQVDLDVSIASVETDFSLTPLENNDNFQDLSDIHDGVSSKQVVITLSAGEYVVTVSAKRPGRSESHSTAEKAVLTPASVDANLQLVFDCLDREGRQELSESDISNFLLQYEHMTPSQRGKEALRSFLHQHGSSSSFGSEERRLTLDDFREIYLGQAIQDSHEDLANYSISSKTISSASVRARFQELVWQDLLRLLPSSSSGVDLPAENPRTELKRRDIVDLVCCFHSDTPLLNVVALPEDKSSIDSNNFNI